MGCCFSSVPDAFLHLGAFTSTNWLDMASLGDSRYHTGARVEHLLGSVPVQWALLGLGSGGIRTLSSVPDRQW